MTDVTDAPPYRTPRAPLPSAPRPVNFNGENADFRHIVVKGALLELVTFGFYRFWLATSIRRHLWSNTRIDGDALEYTGTARELFLGFLFAIAILGPAYLVYFLIGIEATRFKAFASAPLGLLYYLLLQFAVYRGRRYRMNRTSWRGVRFGMTGSGVKYALISFGWLIATVLTLGILYPWREAALERFKMQHSYYGNLPGSFQGAGGGLFKRAWWLLAIILAGIAALAGAGALSAQKAIHPGFVVVLAIAFEISLVFIYGTFKTIEWRWWIEGLRLGPVTAQSDLRAGPYIANYWKLIGMFLLLTAVFGAVIALVAALLGPAKGAMIPGARPPVAMLAGMGISYLLFIVAFLAVLRIYTMQRIWKMMTSSVTLTGLAETGDVIARGDKISALGEGLGGSLDVFGF